MRIKVLCFILAVLSVLLCGCGNAAAKQAENAPQLELSQKQLQQAYIDVVKLEIEEPEQEVALVSEPPEAAIPDIMTPVASGELVMATERVSIDYSNTTDGYVMVCFTGETNRRLKVQVKGPSTTYTYNLPQGEWTVFPLSDGNGSYQVKVFENAGGSSYSLVGAAEMQVEMANEFAPFLRPNQYVNYSVSSAAVEKARELTSHVRLPLEMVEVIYNFVVTELTYDNHKAATVKSGYIPVLDTVLEEKKGICFDYASLMTGMLRSQGIPCKMVFGYTNGAYHAWISVWTEETGWLDGVIFFDGVAWQRMDPTFASSAGQSEQIMKYIGNGTNYSEKYFY